MNFKKKLYNGKKKGLMERAYDYNIYDENYNVVNEQTNLKKIKLYNGKKEGLLERAYDFNIYNENYNVVNEQTQTKLKKRLIFRRKDKKHKS